MASLRSSSSFWCYRCNRVVRVSLVAEPQRDPTILCPDCHSGFLEEVQTPPQSRRSTRAGSPFNPVIVLRGGNGNENASANESENDVASGNFELYYNDGVSGPGPSGLRPLPAGVTDFLMGSSGFDHLLDQLDGTTVRLDRAASKAAIESMPVVKILASHAHAESHCAVCMENFQVDCDAREMPCGHVYHSECIVPWLSVRNSCPVCRRVVPSDEVDDNNTMGLTIWRLPGGGFAVGRLIGGRELPLVYTEMDGAFNASNGVPRRVSWDSSIGRSRESRGFASAFRNLVSYFGRVRSSFSRGTRNSRLNGRSRSATTIFSRFRSRSRF
ncbi:E3 ubiquitin-protein ligase RDUF1-like [Vigna umbellata]|uniref:RING-type E3 ubiquitin transferase n=2 Tax=Phaseolus angularis TaxID=3914 RepID=A0A0L9U5J1_PHAAN|nr:E3 ubiquitin-protein ligase RDUF1 [Vigna angularis]XP_047176581.1 E3 ubiquitin-protein ligase RDUF1-like [Vigna umbellata]KAG2404953.1 E3 ubiquitin-protein [Vigna angularis]KOM38040.1 hypothetical protein LR48_Vigan03g142200 [Vigna angularis]BAT84482.1 hypothetical protein VIGAN_04187700 [Vigna angularis var. angularis]